MPWDNSPEKRRRDQQTYGSAYKRKRLECLRAANWHCQIKIPGVCIGAASECDHVDQAGNDPQHQRLRAACKPCHARVTAQQGRGARAGQAADPEPRPRTQW